jgi:anti-sigma B factor antagonist
MESGSQQLEIRVHEGECCARLSLCGELDVASAALLMEHLTLVNESGVAEVELDLAELSYIDPSGLSVLAVEKRRADASGMALRITSPTTFVRQMLDITGLIDFLDVTPEVDDGSNGDGGGDVPPGPASTGLLS